MGETTAHFTSYAKEGKLSLKVPLSADELQAKVSTTLSEITNSLDNLGCKLIGHIKALLKAGTCGYLFFSVTTFGQEPRKKGNLTGNIETADLTINVIVYEVNRETIEKVVAKAWTRQFGEQALS